MKIVVQAFSNMIRLAAENPGTALANLIATIFSPSGLKFTVFYIGLVVIGGIAFGSSMIEAGFKEGLLLDLMFYALMLSVLLVFVTPTVISRFAHIGSDTHGSARFATNKEVSPLTRTDTGLLIGRDGKTGKLLRYDGPSYLLTMAPTRTGKGVGTIIPNLLTADHSVICIDPKGENAKIASRAREKFGPVHVLDPFGLTGLPSAAFNPLDALDLSGLDVAEDASTLADAPRVR